MNSITKIAFKSAVFYEVNLRQYTWEGNIQAFLPFLPALKEMGVTVLWLMPIHPIGIARRKGTLGSYYSIRDFEDINPEFGSKEDFRKLVWEAHQHGLKVIIDWVANHASWDNVWTTETPEFFERDDQGGFKAPFDWDDVIQIDHQSEPQQTRMIGAMRYWVAEFDIDGFRADLAHLTPLTFWLRARKELDAFRANLIWLAETETIEYYKAFDITYAWKWMHASEEILKADAATTKLRNFLDEQKRALPPDALQLFFTTNHDENSWNGTEYEKYGVYAKALTVFAFLYPNSVPLVYSGQEIPNMRRLKFFDKDHLEWNESQLAGFYQKLSSLRQNFAGNELTFIDAHEDLFCFQKKNDDSVLIVILHLGTTPIRTTLRLPVFVGELVNIFADFVVEGSAEIQIALDPGDFLCLISK